MTSASNMHRHHVQHRTPMPAIVCEGFLPHLTTAVVEHVEELDKS